MPLAPPNRRMLKRIRGPWSNGTPMLPRRRRSQAIARRRRVKGAKLALPDGRRPPLMRLSSDTWLDSLCGLGPCLR